jgi:hypothetical protein
MRYIILYIILYSIDIYSISTLDRIRRIQVTYEEAIACDANHKSSKLFLMSFHWRIVVRIILCSRTFCRTFHWIATLVVSSTFVTVVLISTNVIAVAKRGRHGIESLLQLRADGNVLAQDVHVDRIPLLLAFRKPRMFQRLGLKMR